MTACTTRRIWSYARITFCAVILIAMAAPLTWTLFLSLRSNTDLLRGAALNPLGPYTLDNYLELLKTPTLFRWFFNSLLVSSTTVAAVLALSSLAGPLSSPDTAAARLRPINAIPESAKPSVSTLDPTNTRSSTRLDVAVRRFAV